VNGLELPSFVRPGRRTRVPVPAYEGRSIVNAAVSAYRASGRGDGPDDESALAPPLTPEIDPFRGGSAEGPVVVFLVDALGWNTLDEWVRATPDDELRRRWREAAQPITTVFPTTTTAALTSVSTGAVPARHGIVGYRQFLPRWGVLADLLKMSPVGLGAREQLIGPNWSPREISGVPTLFERRRSGVAVTREEFQGTGFTRLLYEGAEFVPYATGSDLALQLARVLERPTPPPLVYVYWPELDTAFHLNGPDPFLADLELRRLDLLLRAVAGRLSPRHRASCSILLTADHGHVPVRPDAVLAIDKEAEIARELAYPPGGDRRAAYLKAKPGRSEALRRAVEVRLPPGGRVVELAAAVEDGLFGPPPFHPELFDRLGDFVLVVPPPAAVQYTPPGFPAPKRHVLGSHGGFATEELLVPLVAAPFARWA
jgi:hypothetical protein